MPVKLLLLTLTLTLLSSCASNTAPFAIASEDTWFLEQSGGDTYPIYCMANKKNEAAEPACFRAKKKYSNGRIFRAD